MAYENLNFFKPNMTFVDGYFYMFEDVHDVLLQKLDDGSTAFSYPLNTLLTTANVVTSLEHDGINFWTMQDMSGGVRIKRWQIENDVVELKETFEFSPNFDSDAFTVEHYHDTLISGSSSGATASGTVLYLNRYTDVVASGIKLTLGPNSSNQYEEVEVSAVNGSDIILVSGTQNSYNFGDTVNFYNHLWIFNNYSTGSLHKVDAYTGTNLNTYNDVEYDNITACTFARIAPVSTVDTLVYVKSTNLKCLNIDTLANYGVMTIDNIRVDNVTVLRVYDLSICGNNIYRLQKAATYYGVNYSWNYYNYVLSTSRRFLDTTSLSVYPVILPANGVNVVEVTMLVDDQYGEGIYNKPVFFTDDDPVGFITTNPAYTDYFFGTGEAVTYYKAGVTVDTVTIEATATQYD